MSRKNIRNLLRVLDRAQEIDIDEGRVAYWRYREVCGYLGDYYGYPLPQVIAVFAALSPNTDYFNNLRSAATVLDGHKRGLPVDRIRVSSYNHCRDRAFTYLNGVSFMDTVKGKKIRSFYSNILNPLDPYPVTIDGHAVNAWRGVVRSVKDVAVEGFNYEIVAADYREVSRRLSLLPNQTQAILWFTWKRINNIVATKNQLELFLDRSKDVWKTVYYPEDIKPYKPLY